MLSQYLINFISHETKISKPIGSGLGLAICKQIIEHHKGTIKALPNITLSYVHCTQIQHNRKQLKDEKILIVDDEPNIVMSEYTFKKIILRFYST
jgi:light-regulated signal transduction histidine kinase (bacteriophytochrome)